TYATLHRFAVVELNFGRTATTIPVADGAPREELQLDTGWVGCLMLTGHKRVDLYCRSLALSVCLSDVRGDDRARDRRLRGRLGVLRRCDGVIASLRLPR